MSVLEFASEVVLTPRPFLKQTSLRDHRVADCETERETVHLVEDDQNVRTEISAALSAVGIEVIAFPSAEEYLRFSDRERASCVIVNFCMPDCRGLELLRKMVKAEAPPIIFISDHPDVASAVSAIKTGAFDFLTEPLDSPALLTAIRKAFAFNRRRCAQKAEAAKLRSRFARLTPREREVFSLVVRGLLNKQASSLLGISEVTLQIHRSQVMRKMEAKSLADLVRMSIKLRIPLWRGSLSPEDSGGGLNLPEKMGTQI